MHLTCVPESICSWNFRISDASRDVGSVRLDFLTEQGTIKSGDTTFDVIKHGWLSGHWSLNQRSSVHANAHKPLIFTRQFEITTESSTVSLKADMLARRFIIYVSDKAVGSITPAHAFTRRATIDCSSEIPEIVQLFCFWLAALMWKRDSDSASGG